MKIVWWIIGIVIIISIVAILVFIAKSNSKKLKNEPNSLTRGLSSSAIEAGKQLSGGRCSGTGPGQLTHSAMDAKDFSMIIPYGLMVGGHVTPIDHQYYSPISYQSPRDAYPVYAMGDARLVSIEHRTEIPQDNSAVRNRITDEYRLIFTQSCTFFYYYDLLTSLTPELTKLVGDKRNASVDVPVKAGDKIGAIGGQTLDFAVWNTEKQLPGFIVPEHYRAEAWKIYTADPLDYQTAELKKMMLDKYPRVNEPLSGKIDWDIDGTLQGTWFAQGTNYLEGDRSNPKGPWVGHLSFAPNLYDPNRWIVSMGDYPVAQEANTQVSATQFYAKATSPSPTKITPESGLTKIELVHEDYIKPDGQPWHLQNGEFVKGPKVGTARESEILAVALVQLTDQRTLKFQIFPNKTAADVNGFDSDAKIYTR